MLDQPHHARQERLERSCLAISRAAASSPAFRRLIIDCCCLLPEPHNRCMFTIAACPSLHDHRCVDLLASTSSLHVHHRPPQAIARCHTCYLTRGLAISIERRRPTAILTSVARHARSVGAGHHQASLTLRSRNLTHPDSYNLRLARLSPRLS